MKRKTNDLFISIGAVGGALFVCGLLMGVIFDGPAAPIWIRAVSFMLMILGALLFFFFSFILGHFASFGNYAVKSNWLGVSQTGKPFNNASAEAASPLKVMGLWVEDDDSKRKVEEND